MSIAKAVIRQTTKTTDILIKMNRRITVDPYLEQDINRLMVCAPLQCPRQLSCFRVARFARDKIRDMHIEAAKYESELSDTDCEQYAVTKLYQEAGAWEAA